MLSYYLICLSAGACVLIIGFTVFIYAEKIDIYGFGSLMIAFGSLLMGISLYEMLK